ncbi:glycosyltransferase family 2 protein [Lewinella sp. IMCC34191]|uniref:glycosyltransferase family 2 protein n=1 Tax=Lewinella sp. IMCC34191 TaxID=2259172 RepID=UPI001300B950|nr:glycosyltransferase family A protein [Lewinella sp. IMCC34191]
MRELPEVSVSIITYNQRELVGRAIDSALRQETSFPFEIIIGDDCSNDGTQDVLRDYKARYPDKIQLILHPVRYKNEVPGRTNNTTNLLNCRGKYTAMLDGDDYWTDPHKLERQYRILEDRPDIAYCLHDARMAYHQTPKYEPYIRKMSEKVNCPPTGVYSQADLAMRNVLAPHIGSIMYRTDQLRDLPDWFYKVIAADYALLLHLSRNGSIYYDERDDAAYYISPAGFQQVFRKNPTHLHQELRDIETYNKHFPATRGSAQGTRGKAILHFHLYQHYRDEKENRRAARHLYRVFRHDPLFVGQLILSSLKGNKGYRPASKRANKSAEKSAEIRS